MSQIETPGEPTIASSEQTSTDNPDVDTAQPATRKDKSASDESCTTTESRDHAEISQEEKDVYQVIVREKESITKSIDTMMSCLSKFESDAQDKSKLIEDIFGALTQHLESRKQSLLRELDENVLKSKTEALTQIESLRKYQDTLSELEEQYKSLTTAHGDDDNHADDEKKATVSPSQRKQTILAISQQMEEHKDSRKEEQTNEQFAYEMNVRLDSQEMESMIAGFGSVRVGKAGDFDYDEEKVPSFIDSNLELLLAEIPVKKLYRWALKDAEKSDDEYTWKSRCQRAIILFYQNKKSYKVRMVVQEKESESDKLLMNQWVAIKQLAEKEKLVWLWSSFDASVAAEEGDEKKGYTKWCAKFFDEIAFERFEDQYNQARKINIQVMENEEKLRKQREKQLRLKKEFERVSKDTEGGNKEIHDEDAIYYENDERLCFEMDVWKTYLWQKDAAGKGAWKGYADKAVLQFFENRNTQKVRIVLRESETKQLKLNHWIPTDCSLKSRGDQMWEWQVYDELAKQFLNESSTLKIATICCTFIDKDDTQKFKQLFEKYQKINQKAEEL